MFRQIIHPRNSNELNIRLPEEYLSKEVEVIAFEIAGSSIDSNIEMAHIEKVKKAFEAIEHLRVSTKGFKFNREEANER